MVTADAVRAVIMFMFASLIAFTGNWGQWGAFAPLVLVGAFSAMFFAGAIRAVAGYCG